MFEKLIDWLLGVRLISKEDALAKFQTALDRCDSDDDGYLSLRELIRLFKEYAKEVSHD